MPSPRRAMKYSGAHKVHTITHGITTTPWHNSNKTQGAEDMTKENKAESRNGYEVMETDGARPESRGLR